VLIDPDQSHETHMQVHLQFSGSIIKGIQDKQEDPVAADKAMQSLIPHMLTHLKYMEEDPTQEAKYNEFNEQVSELMKIADQLNRMAADIQQKQMEQAQQQQGQGAQDPKTMLAMNKIELDRMKFQNDAMIKRAKADHQMQISDRKTAQRLMIDKIKVAQKYGSIQP